MNDTHKKLREVLQEFDCQTGTLHRADGEMLHLVSQVGIPDSLMAKIEVIPFGKGIAGVAAAQRGPVELCNLQEDLGGVAKVEARKTGVAGSLAVPILGADGMEVLGTIGIGKHESYDFSEEEKQRLAVIGRSFVNLLTA